MAWHSIFKDGVKVWVEDVITILVDPALTRFNAYTIEGGIYRKRRGKKQDAHRR